MHFVLPPLDNDNKTSSEELSHLRPYFLHPHHVFLPTNLTNNDFQVNTACWEYYFDQLEALFHPQLDPSRKYETSKLAGFSFSNGVHAGNMWFGKYLSAYMYCEVVIELYRDIPSGCILQAECLQGDSDLFEEIWGEILQALKLPVVPKVQQTLRSIDSTVLPISPAEDDIHFLQHLLNLGKDGKSTELKILVLRKLSILQRDRSHVFFQEVCEQTASFLFEALTQPLPLLRDFSIATIYAFMNHPGLQDIFDDRHKSVLHEIVEFMSAHDHQEVDYYSIRHVMGYCFGIVSSMIARGLGEGIDLDVLILCEEQHLPARLKFDANLVEFYRFLLNKQNVRFQDAIPTLPAADIARNVHQRLQDLLDFVRESKDFSSLQMVYSLHKDIVKYFAKSANLSSVHLVVKKSAVLNTFNDLAAFNLRIQIAKDLFYMVSDGKEIKQQYEEDINALKNALSTAVTDVIDQIDAIKRSANELKSFFQNVKEIAEADESPFLQFILKLESKVEGTRVLSRQDVSELEASMEDVLNRQVAAMPSLALQRKEQQQWMDKILDDKPLAAEESSSRLQTLQKLLIAEEVTLDGIRLGMGGFGVVQRGSFQAMRVAVKSIITNGTEITKQELDAVENEILLMNFIGAHPNILSCFGYYKDEQQTMHMVLEYAPYNSLSSIIYATNIYMDLPMRLVFAWLRDLANALQFIHSKGVKHRDVKAENILVFEGFKIKLCDFGLAKRQASISSKRLHGTLAFMAPEARILKGSTTASDVYSWAMTAYQLIMRRVPDSTHGAMQLIHNAMERVFEDPTINDPILQRRLKHLLESCIQDRPLTRPTAAEAKQQLGDILALLGGDPRTQSDAVIETMEEIARKIAVKRETDYVNQIKKADSGITTQDMFSVISFGSQSYAKIAVRLANIKKTLSQSSNIQATQDELIQSGDCAYVVHTVMIEDEPIQLTALQILQDFVTNNYMTIAMHGGITKLANLLRHNSLEVRLLASIILRTMSEHTDIAVMMCEQGCVTPFTFSLRDPSMTVKGNACQALHQALVASEDNYSTTYQLVVNAAGIPALMKLVMQADADEETKFSALSILTKLYPTEWERADYVQGPVEFSALLDLLDNPSLQILTLELLVFLTSFEANVSEFCGQFGVKLMVELLEGSEPRARNYALLVLKNLASLPNNELAKQNIGAFNGVLRLVDLLKEDEEEDLLENVLVTLHGILDAYHVNAKQLVKKTNFFGQLPMLMRHDSEHVREACAAFVFEMSSTPELLSIFREVLLLMVPNLLLLTEDNDENIACYALNILSNICADDTIGLVVITQGISLLVRLASNTNSTVNFRTVLSTLLVTITKRYPPNQDVLRGEGGIELMLQWLIDCEHLILQKQAIHVLAAVSIDNEANTDFILEIGGMQVLCDVIRENDLIVKKALLHALTEVASNNLLDKRLCRAADLIRLLVDLLSDGDEELNRAASSMLSYISGEEPEYI